MTERIIQLERYGTDYGGFVVAPDFIKQEGIALCAGVGEDISFDEVLINRHKMRIVGVDPTEKAKRFITNKQIKEYHFIDKALVSSNGPSEITIFHNANPSWVSESIYDSHSMIDKTRSRAVPTITFDSLITQFGNFDLIKMDIEGAEYDLIENLTELNTKILCLEFHHHCTAFKQEDTNNAIKKLESLGFRMIHTNTREFSFLKMDT